jgi:hypothetical protein
MTLKTTEPWSCCMPASVSAIEPGRSLWTLGGRPTLPSPFIVRYSLFAMYVDSFSRSNEIHLALELT